MASEKPSESTLTSTVRAMNTDSESAFQPTRAVPVAETVNEPRRTDGYDASWHKTIKDILLQHWQPTANSPVSTSKDLDTMAAYFSRFPSVRELFSSIASSQWALKYAERTYATQIHGNRLSIDSITVLFDPRSAAQFKFYNACTSKIPYCIASPADVLLHELLHVQSVVLAPKAFIEQGGMNSMMYPVEHERVTISAENILYKSMTSVDRHPRPLRNEHGGRPVLAACATCLQ